jgi:hypothetical protein
VDVVVTVLILVLAGAVLALVSAPLRRARAHEEPQRAPGPEGAEHTLRGERESQQREREELEAAREAKYREIRDTELDYRTGKLSPEDYQTIDADLRAEAIAILDRLERVTPKDA